MGFYGITHRPILCTGHIAGYFTAGDTIGDNAGEFIPPLSRPVVGTRSVSSGSVPFRMHGLHFGED